MIFQAAIMLGCDAKWEKNEKNRWQKKEEMNIKYGHFSRSN